MRSAGLRLTFATQTSFLIMERSRLPRAIVLAPSSKAAVVVLTTQTALDFRFQELYSVIRTT